jgi:uncharacterized protein YjdB
VLTIDTKGVATAVAKGQADLTATLDGVVGKVTLTVADVVVPELKSIAVTPPSPAIAKGTTQDLVATGTYDDASTKDLTAEVSWTSSSSAIATVDAKGVVTGVGGGMATITAKLGAVSGAAVLTVKMVDLATIEISNPDAWLAKGLKEQFTATGIFSDDTRQDLTKLVTWASSSPAVTISNAVGSNGLASCVDLGVAQISATFMGVTGSISFQVTGATITAVAVTPFDPVIAKGTKIAFAATAILTDHSFVNITPFVQWTTSDDKIATIASGPSINGVATAVDVGKVTITATFLGNMSGTTSLSVSAATLSKVSLIPQNPTIAKGTALGLSAIGTFSDGTAQDLTAYALWGSSDATVASVSNVTWQHGVVTALAQGTTTITATITGKSDSTTLTVSPATLTAISVSPANASIAKGTSLAFSAIGIYSDKSLQNLTSVVTWTSSDPSVAISNGLPAWAGVAIGIAEGTSNIKASFAGVTGSTNLKVTSATLTSIEVTSDAGANPTIAKGTSVLLRATGVYSDDSTQDLSHWVVWTSSDASVLVSNASFSHGLALGQVQGSAVVTATFFGGVSGSTTVTVTAATLVSLAIMPASPSLPKGTSVELVCTGTYTDNSTQDLTDFASWASSDPSVAISTWGAARGEAQGVSTITATFGGMSATTDVHVTAATLASVAITPVNPTIAKGTALRFTLTATYTDATTRDATVDATWTSATEAAAIISNAGGAEGLATGVNPGTSVITAYLGGKSVTTTLTVTAATLTLITVTPANPSVAKNGTRQFFAMGTFTDNTVQNLTTQVTWSSSSLANAIISNAVGSKGLATGVAQGSSTISAQLTGKAGSTLLTVTP